MCIYTILWASQVVLVVKNPPGNAGDIRDESLIPTTLGHTCGSSGGGHGNLCSILSWRILWTEEPGGLQSKGSQRVGYD